MLKEVLKQNRKASLHRRLIFLFAVITISIILIFAILLTIFGINGNELNTISTYLNSELMDISEKAEDEFGNLSLLGISLAETISASAENFFEEHNIDAVELAEHPELLSPLLERQAQTLIYTIDNNTCSGIYILLDATINPSAENAEYAKSGMFIKKTFPVNLQHVDTDNHFLRGPADIARQNNIQLMGQWRMEYDISNQDFFNKVIETARLNPDLPLTRLYYWSGRVTLKGDSESGFLLCVPLRTSDNTVFGLCGIEVSDRMIKQIYSPTEINYANVFTLISPMDDEFFYSSQGIIAGNYYLTGHRKEYDLRIQNPQDGFSVFEGDTDTYGGLTTNLRLYPANSVFSKEQWAVAVLLPKENLKTAITGSQHYLGLIIAGLLIISLLASLFISHHYLRPVTEALDSIKNKSYSDGVRNTSYVEIDDLFDFLAQKDKAYEEEIRLLGQQKQTTETEYAKVQTELSFLADKKKKEIDPESYQLFLDHLHTLTRKEREIFNLYLEGKSAKEIIVLMDFTDNALKYHNKNIYSKLGVPSRKELLKYATLMKQENNS